MSSGHSPSQLPKDIRVFERGWLSSTNVVCLGDAPAVIDTGHVKHSAQTVALVREALGDQPLATIAHTHLHSDHCGGTGALQDAWPDAQTWVPEVSLTAVQTWDKSALTFDGTGQRCARFQAQHALCVGDSVQLGQRHWQVHAAPGHDALAVLLFDPQDRILIAGDALWEHGVGVIFPYIDGSDGFEPFEQTLDAIESLRPDWVVPGHGPAINRADGTLDEAMDQARRRIHSFIEKPQRHALYAAKVMIKYQMLDVEAMPNDEFDTWIQAAPFLHDVHRQYWPEVGWTDWVDSVLQPMLDKGILVRDATHIRDGAG